MSRSRCLMNERADGNLWDQVVGALEDAKEQLHQPLLRLHRRRCFLTGSTSARVDRRSELNDFIAALGLTILHFCLGGLES